MMILRDTNSAIDHQQRQAEGIWSALKQHKTNYSDCFQRVFDQNWRHLNQIPKYREVTAGVRDR